MTASYARTIPVPDHPVMPAMQPGGLSHARVVACAGRHLVTGLDPVMKALHVLTDTLEAMTASDFPLAEGELPDMRRVAGRFVSLALTYDQDPLAQAGMRLCGLIAAFHRDGALRYQARRAYQARQAMALCVQVLRLLAPENRVPPSEAAWMLAGLDRLARHFGAVPPVSGKDCAALPLGVSYGGVSCGQTPPLRRAGHGWKVSAGQCRQGAADVAASG